MRFVSLSLKHSSIAGTDSDANSQHSTVAPQMPIYIRNFTTFAGGRLYSEIVCKAKPSHHSHIIQSFSPICELSRLSFVIVECSRNSLQSHGVRILLQNIRERMQ